MSLYAILASLLRYCLIGLLFLSVSHPLLASESFTVKFGSAESAQKIGDLRPKVIPLNKKPVPDVSIKYVMKRYRKLFEKADSPEVRIEALDRLNHLSASYGIYEEGLIIDPYVQAEVVLSTYQKILDLDEDYQRMDELLYQTAKATAFTGQLLESIKRLELLIGLYPSSQLYEESLFRLAESYFDLAEFEKADKYYTELIKRTKAPRLKAFAKYKQAWTAYRLEDSERALNSISSLFDAYRGVYGVLLDTDLNVIPMSASAYSGFDLPQEAKILPDGMRLLAILAENGDRLENIRSTAKQLGGAARESVVLRALVDQLSSKERYFDAARLIESYVEGSPSSYELLAYSKHAVDLYSKGDHLVEAWKSKARLVDTYGLKSNFWNTSNLDIKTKVTPLLSELVLELAHLNFVRMQQSSKNDQRHIKFASDAARYYLQHAALNPSTLDGDESVYLAAQALDSSKRFDRAVQLYLRAGYSEREFKDKGNSAYAALIAKGKSDIRNKAPESVEDAWSKERAELAQRYLDKYPEHQQAANVALALSAEYTASGSSELALSILDRYERFKAASTSQKVRAKFDQAALLYNTDRFASAEASYREIAVLAALDANFELSEELSRNAIDGIANSLFQTADRNDAFDVKVALFRKVSEEFPNHRLAPDALFNAASLATQQQDYAQGAELHYAFLDNYKKHALAGVSRQQLIYGLEKQRLFREAADQLVIQSKALKSSTEAEAQMLSANSIYQAADYYLQEDETDLAKSAYQWLIKNHSSRSDLVVEAYAFAYENSDSKEGEITAARDLLAYIEEASLITGRVSTLGAKAALSLASIERDKFDSIVLSLPFQQSLKQKNRQLDVCTAAYKRVIQFGVSEYDNAARYEMARIYQGLAQSIMTSERPAGLSPLESEQYEVLLEERAIPIEDEAIALYEQNIEATDGVEFDDWVMDSYRALALLNPSMYHRPMIGPSYAPLSN